MRKMMMTLAAVLCCALMTSVFTACSVEDNPVPDPVIVTDLKPFHYDEYIDTSVRPGDDFFRYQYGLWLDNPLEQSLILKSYMELTNLDAVTLKTSNDPVVTKVRQLVKEVEAGNDDKQLLKARIDYLSGIQTQQQLLEAFAQLHQWGYAPVVCHVPLGIERVIRPQLSSEYPTPYMKEAYDSKDTLGVINSIEKICKCLTNFGVSEERIAEINLNARAVSLVEMEAYESMYYMIQKMRYPENYPAIRRAASPAIKQVCELMGIGDLADQIMIDEGTNGEAVKELLNKLFEGSEASVAMMRDYMIAYIMGADMPYLQLPDIKVSASDRILCAMRHVKYHMYRLEVEVLGMENIHKEKCTEMMENFRNILLERIGNLDWMGDATKQAAQEKARKMDFFIGYPDQWNDALTPDVKASTLLEVVGELRRHEAAVNHQMAGKTTAEAGWDFWCSLVPFSTYNAFYDSGNNQLVIMPAFLTAPIFDQTLSEATLYATAYVFGHEMCHGFDAGGSLHDEVGAYRDWWSPADKAAFEAKQQQLITLWGQLEHYPGQPANGTFTLRENMADYGGATLALEAYSRRLHQQGFKDEEFDNQIRKFWLSYGMPVSVFETERSLPALKESYLNDVHSAGHNRVNGIVRLFDDWYRLYDVKSTDKLYVAPEDRVKIW